MRKAMRRGIIFLALAALTGTVWGAGLSFTLKAGHFFPADSLFRDVYKGGLVFGGELAVPVAGVLHLWAGAELFGKTGLLSLSEEETKLRIIPLYLGLRCHFGKSRVRPYIGAAAAYFLFKEENALGSISESGLGFLGQAGLLAGLGGSVWLDVFVNYRACTLKTEGEDPLEAKLDGISAGLGLVFRF